MSERRNRQFVLDTPPTGKLGHDNFRLTESAVPDPADGEALVQARYISMDAANRAWMQGATYRSALTGGMVMAGAGIGVVLASRADGLSPGDLVYGDLGWQDYATLPAEGLRKLEPREPLTHHLSVYGIPGLTAYLGLKEIGVPKPGDTILVSAAAGAVGSLVGQVAKAMGCRTIGIAGGPEKCALLTEQLGFDAAVDYKAEGPLRKRLKAVAPDGVDIYWDNVAGEILEAAIFNMALHGRIICCGAIAHYDGAAPAHGPRGIPGLLVTRRIAMRGFIVFDHYDQRDAALAQLESWVREGRIAVREDIIDGFECLPEALLGLLAGGNVGKRMVRIS